MAITYHSGRRIQATQADFDGTPAVSGGWKELGRTTLGSAATSINVTSLENKRYLMIVNHSIVSGTTVENWRFNSDSGSNYSRRNNDNGGSDYTGVSETAWDRNARSAADNRFNVVYITNLQAEEKLSYSWMADVSTTGAGTAPDRSEYICKWANTSNVIDEINVIAATNQWEIGSECVVLGYDPDDTHTTNFWEELASVDLSGGAATTLTTSTFSAKKYLWIQGFADKSVAVTPRFRVGNAGTIDSGSNYARRRSENGGADATSTSADGVWVEGSVPNGSTFFNFFIVNNASNEKLMIWNYCSINTVGAGGAPDRGEGVAKWTDTTNQITDFQIYNSGGTNFGTNSILKVWGSD